MHTSLTDEARIRRRTVFASSSKEEIIEGASTCNLELDEHGILDKKKVKSSTTDAYKKIRAGASLVQLYTTFAYDGPALIPQIKVCAIIVESNI